MKSCSVAVIGAGVSGLAAIKCLLEEDLDFVCYEKSQDICGLWRYKEDHQDDQSASIMRQLVANTSKEMTAFSDFCPPQQFPNFMHNNKMTEYLELFAREFRLKEHVLFGHEVLEVRPTTDHSLTGRWTLRVRVGSEVLSREFDGVLICSGLNNTAHVPQFDHQDAFKGRIIHSKDYKRSEKFRDKCVLVVGIGNSGGDIATDLSLVADKVLLSTRSGSWVTRRVGLRGLPLDQQFNSRALNALLKATPYRVSCYFGEKYLNLNFDHKTYGLRPKHRLFGRHPTINDDLSGRILSGFVDIKPDIQCFTTNGVIFTGETEETPVDVVVMATGYHLSFPFLPKDVLSVSKQNFHLYKHVFSPHLSHAHTLAVIGCVQPNGAVPPIAELQCRWFALLMKGERHLPPKDQMLKHVAKRHVFIQKRYRGSEERHALQEDWIGYCDELAREVGCRPLVWKLLFTDPRLFWTLLFGPSLPYQYRLRGPHKSPEKARQLILSARKRTMAPLRP